MKVRITMLVVALAPALLWAQTKPRVDAVIDALSTVHTFSRTAISPDGHRVAWVEDRDTGSAIFVKDLPSGAPKRVSASTASALTERGVVWSPDSKRLAFLSDAGSKDQAQLYVTDLAAAPRKLTNIKGQLNDPRWSPDGRSLSVLFVKGSSQAIGALVAYKPDSGVVGDVVEEQRIAIVDASSPTPAATIREVSPGNMFVYDYDWSPDGKAFCAEAVEGSGTNNYWIAQLYTVRADTGVTKSIWKAPLQLAVPRWSPDGKSIAVIEGLMSDEGQNGGDVYVVPAAGGAPADITPKFEGSARWLAFQSNGDLLVQEYVDGKTAFLTVPIGGGARTIRWSAPQQVMDASVSAKGDAAAAVVQSFSAAPEIYAGAIGQWARVTSANTAMKPQWGEAKSIHWKSDAFTVQGWLLYPANFDATKKYPMVVSVHGGPSSANFPVWPQRWNAILPSQGYFVFLPNPRGSYGGGEAFTAANVKDFGYGDLRDVMTGVDAAIAQAPIDPARLGVIGWSYGGYMTMWTVTQTNRFKAAVAGAGIVNWQSYYGQNRIDTWMLPFFGASVYDDPAVYAKSSPITFIKKAKTPTLVLHGDRDSEVPTPQGYEFWHALRAIGTPTELVIYPNEGHAISSIEHQHDIQRRLVAWFDKYLAVK